MIEYSGRAAMVDAIEDGKIVKVAEEYARREGLLILRRESQVPVEGSGVKEKKEEIARKNKGFIGMEDLRKPLRPQQNELMRELVDNFHWTLIQKRKGKGLTRKKLADSIGESETNIKMIESGVLPMNNFILINKLESFYGILLRKNKVASAGRELRQVIDFKKRIMDRRAQRENKGMPQNAEETIDISDSGKEGKNGGRDPLSEDNLDIVDLEKY